MSVSIPGGVHVAVYNAIGRWGSYTVRQIEELFAVYGFTTRVDV